MDHSRVAHRASERALRSPFSAAQLHSHSPHIPIPGPGPKQVGPTSNQQPVFCWSTIRGNRTWVHNGQPGCSDFDWIVLPR